MDFRSALRDIAKKNNPLSKHLMAMLSSPTRAEAEAFATCWGHIDLARRREIAARMVELAEASFELDYVALFRHCLADGDAAVRCHAIKGLWEDDSADLVDSLLTLLATDPDSRVRATAATSLGRFVFQAECDELDQRRGEIIRQVLNRTIEDPNEDIDVVRRAIESIAYINDDAVRRIISRAYDHNDSRMRESALFAMGRSADRFWADIVFAELYSDSPIMRYEAARACGELKLGHAVGQIANLVMDPDREVRGMAVWALGQIGGDQSRAILERLADSQDETLRAIATEALDEMEFLAFSTDLLVPSVSDSGLSEVEFTTKDEEYDPARQDDDAWEDNFIDLD